MRASIVIILAVLFSNHIWAQDREYTFPSVDKLPVIELLPDPFIMKDGSRVETVADWKQQREYLKSMVQHYMYGYRPSTPEDVDGIYVFPWL